jgi:hypothetical protein
MTTTAPSAALIPVTPVFTNTERLALAGFLAGSCQAAPRQQPGCVTDRDPNCDHESPF